VAAVSWDAPCPEGWKCIRPRACSRVGVCVERELIKPKPEASSAEVVNTKE
jgi:hypothetical protein